MHAYTASLPLHVYFQYWTGQMIQSVATIVDGGCVAGRPGVSNAEGYTQCFFVKGSVSCQMVFSDHDVADHFPRDLAYARMKL